MAFFLFLVLNAVLFLRPAELVPSLIGLPIYQVVILSASFFAMSEILQQLDWTRLHRHPVTLCVFGVLVAIFLSHMRHFFLWGARVYSGEFAKVLLYYLLFMGTVTDSRRLHTFFTTLLVLLTVMASLSLLQYHGVIDIPQLRSYQQRAVDAETGQLTVLPRLQSTGIFHDPNDFAMVLVIGLVICLSRALATNWLSAMIWLAPISVFAYALVLTKSRGGALAMLAGLAAFAYSRWGIKSTILLCSVLVPVAGAAVFATRGGAGMEDGTAQSRIQFWSEGFALMKPYPIFGIGSHQFVEEIYYVAHNSFVHCYVELGVVGGTFFFGCFFFAGIVLLLQLRSEEVAFDPDLRKRTVLMLGVLGGVFMSLLTLSRSYEVPTYMVLGMAAVTANLNHVEADAPIITFNNQWAKRLTYASVAFLAALYLFTRTMVRWS